VPASGTLKTQGSKNRSGPPIFCPASNKVAPVTGSLQPAETPVVGLLLCPGSKLGRVAANRYPGRRTLICAVVGTPVRKPTIPPALQPPNICRNASGSSPNLLAADGTL